ncbi:protein E140, putative [Plasmodium vivax]|nr:protein E140, putative [Plasmodium vivax]
MSDEYNLSIDLKKTELLKEHLKAIAKVMHNEFGYFCPSGGVKVPQDHPNEFSKTIWSILYTSWRMEDFTRLNLKSVLNILKRNPYVMGCVYFLIIFTCVYLLTLFLYTKCFRRLIKAIRCKTCRRKKQKREQQESENKDLIENVKKRFFNIMTYVFLSSLLCVLIGLGIWYMISFFKTRNGIYMNVCSASTSIENFLTDRCSVQGGEVDSSCYSLEHIVSDAVSIVEQYQDIKLQIKADLLVDEDRAVPLLTGFLTVFENLKKLQQNVARNNHILEEQYFHTYPVLTRLGRALDAVIQEGEANLQQATGTLDEAKQAVKGAFEEIDQVLGATFKENMEKVNDKITLFNKSINRIIHQYKIKQNLKKYTISILIVKLVLLIPPLLILIGLVLFIFFLVKGDIGNSSHFFLDLFGVFSAYFGFLTIVILLIGIAMLSASILGGTTCIIADRVLKNELNFDVLNDTLIDYCLKNEESPLLSEDITKGLVDNMKSLDTTEMERRVNEYDSYFNDMKRTFRENTRNFVNYMWVVITKPNNNLYVDRIRLNTLKKSLLATSITRDNIKFGKFNLWGTDEYFENLNRHYFSGTQFALCFENEECDREEDKFNINFRSSINDPKYQRMRNHLRNNVLREDLDNVVELFIYKSRVRTEKIFSVDDLDSSMTDKIGWSEYTPRINKREGGKEQTFILRKYLVEDIENLNFKDVVSFFEKIKQKFNTLRDTIITKVQMLVKNTNCSRLVGEMHNLKHIYCDRVVLNMTILSVALVSFSIISFFLWYCFLFFWLYYQMKMM